MFPMPILRWGFLFSVAAITLAVALRLQSPLMGVSEPDGVKRCYKQIRTHDKSQPSAQCFTVRDGKFTRVWNEDKRSRDAPHTNKSDGYVIPGLWDGHGHLLQYGQFLHSVDLFGSKSLEDVRDRIKDFRALNPGAGKKRRWIRGVGWDQAAFGRMPTAVSLIHPPARDAKVVESSLMLRIKADLEDPLLDGVYIMLDRIDVHCTWVSQAVLDLFPKDMPDIPGGEIIREPGMGVFCDNAMTLIMDRWPKPKNKARRKHVKAAMAKLNEVGLVGIHDAGSTHEDHRLFDWMANKKSEHWSLRVYAMLECERRNTFCSSHKKIERRDSMVSVRSVKLFAGRLSHIP